MAARKQSDDQKYQAVMVLLQGNGSLGEICSRYGISQTYLYMLRDHAIVAVSESVKNKQEHPCTSEERLESDLLKAKQLIGDQAIAIQFF